MLEARLGLTPGVRFEQLVGVGRGLEGQPGEREVTQVHYFFCNCSPPASGFEVFVTVGERSGMWLSGMVCGWGSLMVTGG